MYTNGETQNELMTMESIQDMGKALSRMQREQPTLRDQFAMQYLNGYCSKLTLPPLESTIENIAKESYLVADAMLKARK